MARRRASVFAQETIPSLVDRYPGTGVSVPPKLTAAPTSSLDQLAVRERPDPQPIRERSDPQPIRERSDPQPVRERSDPLPIRDPISTAPFTAPTSSTFAERFGSYARGKVDNFAQCEMRMNHLHEENAWLTERINNVANRIEEFGRYGFGGAWNGRMGNNGYGYNGGYNGGYGYPGYNGYNGYPLDGRESSYMEAVREKERRNIGAEKDRVELSLSAQRHHERAKQSAVFEDQDRDWGDSIPTGGMYREKPDFNRDGPKGGAKMTENKFTLAKAVEKPPAEAKPKRSRKVSSFKL